MKESITIRLSNNVLLSGSMFSSHHAASLLTPAQLEDQEFIFGKLVLILLLLPIEFINSTEFYILQHVTMFHNS